MIVGLLVLVLLQNSTHTNRFVEDSVIKISVPGLNVHAGQSKIIYVQITVKKGYHVQANQLKDEFLIPTTLELNGGDIITIAKQSYPVPKKINLEGTDQYLLVYDGNFKVAIHFNAKETARKGKYVLEAKLHYQACDNKTCFFPKEIIFPIGLTIL